MTDTDPRGMDLDWGAQSGQVVAQQQAVETVISMLA
ncbi:hypothetical protein SBA4_6710004 [Candidatus Sulfopaludibacter sp. SbA4]|nr:hypothetical protein SBA4_6710004 [Candidatus Sulfopaludibacter sp. SbA4]